MKITGELVLSHVRSRRNGWHRGTHLFVCLFIKPWPFSELLRIRDKIIHIKALAPYLANKCIVNIGCCCYSIVILAK